MCCLAMGAVGAVTAGRRMGRVPDSPSREQPQPPWLFDFDGDIDSICGYKCIAGHESSG